MNLSKKKRMIKVAVPCVGEEEIREVGKVLRSGMYISGERVKAFEKEFAKYIGTNYAVAVNSGTAALHLALAALGIGTGDEVIVPALTFFATATAVIHNNGIPIFADIDPDTYCMDPKSVESLILERTNVKAIIPVHLYGHPAEMDELWKLIVEYDLNIIEDCAQAHGAEYKGRKVGSISNAGCWSFFATKNMTTGEGGMITTNDPILARKARTMRSHGLVNRNDHVMLGYNYRMTEMGGAIGSIQLSKLDKLNWLRIRNSMYLRRKLRNVKWLRIPPIKPYVKHVFFWCPIQVREDVIGMSTLDVRALLAEKGIGTRHRYNEPLYKQPMLRGHAYPNACPFECSIADSRNYNRVYLPNVEEIAGKMLGLPNHPKLTKKDLIQIAKVIRQL